jgi:hypothetical protein
MGNENMSDEILGDRGKALEEMFFAQESEKLRKSMQEKEELRDKKEALSATSGITDAAVLEHLVALGIGSDTLAALSLVPLVEVAWADGTMDESERSAILSAAEDSGISGESVKITSRRLPARWIRRPGINSNKSCSAALALSQNRPVGFSVSERFRPKRKINWKS